MQKEYNLIKSPEELYTFMEKYIKYGFYGINNKVYEGNSDNFDEAFDKYWILCDKDRILKYRYGNCYDQVELERDWFKKNNYEFKTFFIFFNIGSSNDYFTHTYLAYKDNNKWYYFEHADYLNRGIKEFDDLETLKLYQKDLFISFNKKMGKIINNNIISKIRIIEYNIKRHNCNSDDFYNYINDLIDEE